MNCFPCFQRKNSESNTEQVVPVAQAKDIGPLTQHGDPKPNRSTEVNNKKDDANAVDSSNISAKTFTFRELATATKNFRQECLLSEGGSGRVFKGTLQPSGQVVAVKQLDKNSTQGNKEFLVEVLMLSLLHHPNLLNLIGYCADGDQRLLVYEYLPIGSVAENLLDLKPEKKPLDWIKRMKIASGTAEALEYLHEKANPPVIYRDLKSSNIMLDEEFNPKLSDYGLAKLGGNNTHVTPRVMGNYGYCAPEYERSGELTVKSDVYSFGVILLELITGRRALDTSRPTDEQNLVSWAQPFFRDPKSFPEMADPLLENAFPIKSLNQAVGVAAMCLQDEPAVRPLISDVVAALSFLAVAPPDQPVPATPDQPVPATLEAPTNHHSGDGSRSLDAEINNNKHELEDHTQENRGGSIQPVPIIPLVPTGHHSGDSSSSVVAESNNNKHEIKDHTQEDKGGSDYESGDSYLSSDYEDEDDFAYQQGNNKEGHQQGKVESIELDYEVASMSSSSISSDDESQLGSINKRFSSNAEVQSGNNSLKLKRKSTKKSQQGSVRSRSGRVSDDESCYGSFGSSSRDSSQRGSVRLGSKDGSNMELDNGSAGLSRMQKTSERSKNRSIGSYSRVSSNVKPGKRRVMSAHYGNKEVEEQKL